MQFTYLREGLCDLFAIDGAHELRAFLAILEEDKRGPELHLERAAETLAARVRHLDVPHFRMRGECFGDEGLRAAAVAAPRTAELEESRALHGVDLFALGLGFRVFHGHSEAPSNF